MSTELKTKPVSRGVASDMGATHELYEPRNASESFQHNGHYRSWLDWLAIEAARLERCNRCAVIFFAAGKLGLAVDCKSIVDCSSGVEKRGMH